MTKRSKITVDGVVFHADTELEGDYWVEGRDGHSIFVSPVTYTGHTSSARYAWKVRGLIPHSYDKVSTLREVVRVLRAAGRIPENQGA
jgi:hypothetical protein